MSQLSYRDPRFRAASVTAALMPPWGSHLRALGSIILGLVAGVLLPRALFILLRSVFSASLHGLGRPLLFISASVFCLWLAHRLAPHWRISLAAAALVMSWVYARLVVVLAAANARGETPDQQWLFINQTASSFASTLALGLAAAGMLPDGLVLARRWAGKWTSRGLPREKPSKGPDRGSGPHRPTRQE